MRPRCSPRRAATLAALAALALAGVGCRDHSVSLAFRPDPGERSTYRIAVRAHTVATIGDAAPRRRRSETVFVARQRVLRTGQRGSEVEIALREQGGPERRFVIEVDRGGVLSAVQLVEGVPARALGELGLADVFPPAAGAPPPRRLSPGERWSVDQNLRLAGASPARLTGSGRLASLARVDGVDVARVESSLRLAVRRAARRPEGHVVLDGDQHVESTTTYDLEDGAVVATTTRSRGRYRLTVSPPAGVAGSSVPGTLSVDVRSSVRRTS